MGQAHFVAHNNLEATRVDKVLITTTFALLIWGHSEPAPSSAPWRMDGKWSGNSFLLGSSSLANYGGYLSYFFFPTYTPTTHKQVVSR
jgi:hypothetical protein